MAASRNSLSTDPVLGAVAACLERYVLAGQRVVVGYSGGLDSSVLLHAANRIVGDARLSALYVHHGLHSHADEWEVACAKYCGTLSISFNVRHVSVPLDTGLGVEAAARRLRHQVLTQHPSEWVLLAHHADDQAETLLHNLLRGTGVRGAAAMPEVLGKTLRPFLGLRRALLKTYAVEHSIPWIEDESNRDCRYTRNYLRTTTIPGLNARFPKVTEQLAAAARRFGEAQMLLDELATIDLQGNSTKFPIPAGLFRDTSAARASNLLRALLVWHHVQAPDEFRLREFIRQIREAGSDRHPRLDVAGYSLWYAKGKLHFQHTDS